MLETETMRQAAERGRPVLLSRGLVAAILAATMVVGGCAFVGDKYEYVECECPLAEQLAASIDWLGTGQGPDSVSSYGVEGLLHVNVTYSEFATLADASAAYESLLDALGEAGINPRGRISGNAFSLQLMLEPPFAGEGGQRVVAGVRFGGGDRQAAEALAPLVEALGTRS